jgi:ABC-type lipoprotein export system ATPase subunit
LGGASHEPRHPCYLVALIGSSGGGKSTLLELIVVLTAPTIG